VRKTIDDGGRGDGNGERYVEMEGEFHVFGWMEGRTNDDFERTIMMMRVCVCVGRGNSVGRVQIAYRSTMGKNDFFFFDFLCVRRMRRAWGMHGETIHYTTRE
jgi:hypothetical protein